MTLLSVFPLDVILPSFSALALDFHVSTKLVSYSVSTFALGVAVSQFLIGPLSDRLGRKRLLITGLATAIVGSFGCMLAANYAVFMVFRMIQALGCGCFVLSQALVEDVFRESQRVAMRIVMASASGLFISLSPLAGSLLQVYFGWRGSFAAFIVIAAIVAALATVLIEERSVALKADGIFHSYTLLTKDGPFLGCCVIAALGFACHFSFIVVSPAVLIDRLGLSTWLFSWVFIGYGISFIFGGWLARWLNRRLSAHAQMSIGLCFIGAAALLLGGWFFFGGLSVSGVLIPMVICTTGTTILRPAAITSALGRHPERAGAAASLSNIVLFLFGGSISSLVATFETTTPLGLVLILVTTFLGGGLLLRCLGKLR